MILVGLTGGVATGKSTVARMFKRFGAVVIDADLLARRAVEPGTPAWRKILKTFGEDILYPNRKINRRALGAIVFRDRAKRRALERIIHPFVAREQTRLAKIAARTDPKAVVIYDVPLLFEAGLHKRVGHTIVVTADRLTQIHRLQHRNGVTRVEATRRIRSQMPLEKKVTLADSVLDGASPRPVLRKAVLDLYQRLKQLA